jgi:hypothetical protein
LSSLAMARFVCFTSIYRAQYRHTSAHRSRGLCLLLWLAGWRGRN